MVYAIAYVTKTCYFDPNWQLFLGKPNICMFSCPKLLYRVYFLKYTGFLNVF